MTENELFSKSGMAFHGSNRVFTGPDGREYKWELRSSKVEVRLSRCHDLQPGSDGSFSLVQLYFNDGTERIAAKYHRPHWGFMVAPSTSATLTIYEPADAIADTILTTFVYLEKLRVDREMALRISLS